MHARWGIKDPALPRLLSLHQSKIRIQRFSVKFEAIQIAAHSSICDAQIRHSENSAFNPKGAFIVASVTLETRCRYASVHYYFGTVDHVSAKRQVFIMRLTVSFEGSCYPARGGGYRRHLHSRTRCDSVRTATVLNLKFQRHRLAAGADFTQLT